MDNRSLPPGSERLKQVMDPRLAAEPDPDDAVGDRDAPGEELGSGVRVDLNQMGFDRLREKDVRLDAAQVGGSPFHTERSGDGTSRSVGGDQYLEPDLRGPGSARDDTIALDAPDRALESELGPGIGGSLGHLPVELPPVHDECLGASCIEDQLTAKVGDDPGSLDPVPDGPIRDEAFCDSCRGKEACALHRMTYGSVFFQDQSRES